MSDIDVYLEKLAVFAELLRTDGLSIGPAETADAAAVLSAIGMDDRTKVKAALMTVYAKSRDEQKIFSRDFDSFFVSEEVMRQQMKEAARRQREEDAARQQAEQDLSGERAPHLSKDQMDAYMSLPEEEKDRLKRIMDTYSSNMERDNERLYTSFIHSVFAKSILEQQLKMEDAALGAQAADPESGLAFREISLFKDSEIPRATALIQTISQQVAGELSSKKKKRGRRGKIDFRRTIRKGLETGGSLHHLAYRQARRRRRNLVLLCDVSGSMMQFSEFALRFIQEMALLSESSRTFLFSESVYEADAFSLQNMDLFRNYVRASGLYGRGTDLGTALYELVRTHPAVLNHSTTLLILSDAKTVDQPRALYYLHRAQQMAGQVIWLNPIPESKWKFLTSSQLFASRCTMLSCSTLHSLAAACRRLGAV